MPGNPFDFLRTATPDQLVCVTVNITAYASRAHTVYIVAQDDMPTYKVGPWRSIQPSNQDQAPHAAGTTGLVRHHRLGQAPQPWTGILSGWVCVYQL